MGKHKSKHILKTVEQAPQAPWPKRLLLEFPWLKDVVVGPGSAWRDKPPSEFPSAHASAYGQDLFGLWYELQINDAKQRMRWIPAGEFQMGERKGQHHVTLTQGFWLADTACSQAFWKVVMGENPSRFKGDNRPVEQVSWDDIQAFLKSLNQKVPNRLFSLPTEAQWEYACRAGTSSEYWWGDTVDKTQANFDKSKIGQTVAVDHYAPNPWGLYQMHGNVLEWCRDWHGDYPKGQAEDPMGPEQGDFRVLRGGGWNYNGNELRAALRYGSEPDDRNLSIGFRIAEGLPNLGAEPRRKD